MAAAAAQPPFSPLRTHTSRLSHQPLPAASLSVGEEDGALTALWQSTRPAARSVSSSSSPASARSQRALESGHVFVRHCLSGRHVSSERVVLFVVSGVLYACHHTRHQSRYRQPFIALKLCEAAAHRPLLVYMGKQTAALRLVPSTVAPERRCFALHFESTLLELEAPGSGDVRYWLRSLYELLTRHYSLSVPHSLVFLPPASVSAEQLARAECRVRQLRMDGQRARRREEAERRMDGEQRVADEKARSERVRAEECEQLRLRWAAAQQEAEGRVATSASTAVLSPSRVLCEDQARLDGDRRMHEACKREADVELERRRHAAVQPPPHVPALASEYAKLNQRCTALQTHTTAPIVAHLAHGNSNEDGEGGNIKRRLGASKSVPNLIAALSSSSFSSSSSPSSPGPASRSAVAPPSSNTRSRSSPALRSGSLSQHPFSCEVRQSELRCQSLAVSQSASLPDAPRSCTTSATHQLHPTDATQPLTAPRSPSAALASSHHSQPPSSTPSTSSSSCHSPCHSLRTPSWSSTGSFSSPVSSTPALADLSSCSEPSSHSLLASSPSWCASSLLPFELVSPRLTFPYGASLYSPTHCLPVTTVYAVRHSSAGSEQHRPLSVVPAPYGDSNITESAAATPDRLPSAVSAPPMPSSIRFRCAVELPDFSIASPTHHPPVSCPPPAPSVGGTHFHFHLHTALTSDSTPAPPNTVSWPSSHPPPPYTADCAC